MRVWPVTASVVLASAVVSAAESVPSTDFWLWFDEYANEQGQVFDPVALVETQLHLEPVKQTASSPNEADALHEVNRDESIDHNTTSVND